MQVDLAAAAVSALVAAPLMESPVYLQRALGLPVRQDVFAEGGLRLGVRGRATTLVGYLGHTVLSVLIASLYVIFFHLVGTNALLVWGVVGGLVHFTIGGLVVGAAFPVVDAGARAAGVRRPGFAYRCYGSRDVITFAVGHLSFGLLTGILYGYFHSGGGSGLAF